MITASASSGGPSRSSISQGETGSLRLILPHGGAGAHGSLGQCAGQGLRQRVHAVGQGHEHAVPRPGGLPLETAAAAAARFAPAGQDQAAVLALHRQKLGQGRLQAQVVGVGRVDPRDQRLNQPVQSLAAQPAAHERRQALLAVFIAAGNDQIHQETELAPPRQDRRRQNRHQPVWRHQHKALRHRHQPAVANDERSTMARRRSRSTGPREPSRWHNSIPHGLFVMNESGPPSSVNPSNRSVQSTPPSRSLASRTVNSTGRAHRSGSLVNPVRGRQAREPSADHDHASRLHPVRYTLRQNGLLLRHAW